MPASSGLIAGVPPGAPLLFVDTCALLDVLRLAIRGNNAAAEVGAIVGMEAASAASPSRLTLVTLDLVRSEWADNEPTVHAEVVRYIARVDADSERVCDCLSLLGSPRVVSPLAPMSVEAQLLSLAQRIIHVSTELTVDSTMRDRAYARQVKAIGPARKGKDCLKDCTIAEGLLDLVRAYRANGHMAPVVFLSSNKHDFGDGGGQPHDDLKADFKSLAITWCSEWSWAQHALGV